MLPALTIPLAGLNEATRRLNSAAANSVQRPGFASNLTQQAAGASPASAAAGATGTPGGGLTREAAFAISSSAYIPSLAEDSVNVRAAVASYRANAKVLRVLSGLQQELLNSFQPVRQSS